MGNVPSFTDDEWQRIACVLPPAKATARRVDDRRIVAALIYCDGRKLSAEEAAPLFKLSASTLRTRAARWQSALPGIVRAGAPAVARWEAEAERDCPLTQLMAWVAAGETCLRR